MTSGDQERAIIIGAGPAGLTAAFELLTRTGIKPIVLEKSDYIGGIARMVNYKGNRIDIGGHRFFSKSDRVMDWWLKILPLQTSEKSPVTIQYHGMEQAVTPSASVPDTDSEDRVMLLRRRKSHIYYMRHFFEYPISFNWDALVKIGFWRACKMGLSYIRSALFPLKQQDTREQFLINRFGRELYRWFFKSYKVVYGKDLGRSVRSDQRRVGRPTH